MNKSIISIITLILLIPIVMAIPTFHHFYGNVYDINGTIINETISVVAYINNESHSNINSINGSYGYEELFFVENGNDGDIITFYINGYPSINYTFTNEQATELSLILNESKEQVLCGNTIIDLGEECDTTNIIDSCTSLGFTGGSLTCKSDCKLDSSACTSGGGGAGGGGGGGGAGGGGGGGGIPRRINLDTKEEFKKEGYTAKQTQGDEAVFTVNNKEYTIKVAKLRSDSVTLDVAGSSSVFKEEDKKEFDVNNDRYNDISIALKEISGGRAEITYKKLFKPEEKMAPPKIPIVIKKEEVIQKLPPPEPLPGGIIEFFKNKKIITIISISIIVILMLSLGVYKLITTLKPKPKTTINTERLKAYIHKTLEQRYSKEKILEACMKVGWKREIVEKLLKENEKIKN